MVEPWQRIRTSIYLCKLQTLRLVPSQILWFDSPFITRAVSDYFPDYLLCCTPGFGRSGSYNRSRSRHCTIIEFPESTTTFGCLQICFLQGHQQCGKQSREIDHVGSWWTPSRNLSGLYNVVGFQSPVRSDARRPKRCAG